MFTLLVTYDSLQQFNLSYSPLSHSVPELQTPSHNALGNKLNGKSLRVMSHNPQINVHPNIAQIGS